VRVALISDIHANLIALEAVLAEIEREGIERIVCLGDVAGGIHSDKILRGVARS
jgi:predicted phosphodiesterase